MIEFLHSHFVMVLLVACGAVLVPTGLGAFFLGRRLRERDLLGEQRDNRRGKRPTVKVRHGNERTRVGRRARFY